MILVQEGLFFVDMQGARGISTLSSALCFAGSLTLNPETLKPYFRDIQNIGKSGGRYLNPENSIIGFWA